MTVEAFREAVKKDGWIVIMKGGYIYFKRRDLSKPDNQGRLYSCHTKNMDEAMRTIQEWILYGFPLTKSEKKKEITFIDFLYSVWSEDGEYFRSAEMEGRHITKAYILHQRYFVRCYFEDFFKDTQLSEINERKLNDFMDYVYSYKSKKTGRLLARSTAIMIKDCCITPLKWGRKKGYVKQIIDFLTVCPNISRKPMMDRGILTAEETVKLLLHDWKNRKAYIAFCIAVNCGLRIGEIRALRIGNIKNGFIVVNSSFNDIDGLKSTKNGKARLVPCPTDLMKAIAGYVFSLPEEERAADCFLLSDDIHRSQPLNRVYCIKRFYKALKECGIPRIRKNALTGKQEYICFHSLRHQTATRWVESGLDIRLIAEAMGHTVKMLEHYSNHLNMHDMALLRDGLEKSNTLGIVDKSLQEK